MYIYIDVVMYSGADNLFELLSSHRKKTTISKKDYTERNIISTVNSDVIR